MTICQRMRWSVSQWCDLPQWEKSRWLDYESERVAFAHQLLELSTDENGKTYLEQYIPIMLSLKN
jgi:hypothetical protein